MKAQAIYAAQPNVVELREMEVPDTPRPHQLLVETRYSVLSPGTELDCLSGKESGWFHIPAPLGYCAAAEVLAVGESVTGYAVGELVLSATPHATHAVIDHDWVRGVVPAGVEPRLAPLVHIALIAITALRVSSAELGDWAVVIGQGLVGNLASQFLVRQGCRVVGVDRVPSRLEISRRCGIEMVADASASNVSEVVEELTAGRGAEIVIEATGTAPAALLGVELTARNGEMILLGTPRGAYQADIMPLLRAVHRNNPNLTIKGAHGGSIRSLPDPYLKHSLMRNSRIIMEMVQRRELSLEPLVTRVAEPAEAPDVYRSQREHPDRQLGVVFDWS
ncbi:MAG: zinc-binding alcohol dehydrogenase [Armatimonadota bacterium]